VRWNLNAGVIFFYFFPWFDELDLCKTYGLCNFMLISELCS
jgi:hypothetical protein